MPEVQNRDPYAPPPMHHDRSGAVLRVAVLAGLLGAAAWGYAAFSSQDQTALVPEPIQEQQMADAGYATSPSTLPEGAAESLPEATPAPAARAAAPSRRSAPVASPAEPTPPPESPNMTAPIPATPIPPLDTPQGE